MSYENRSFSPEKQTEEPKIESKEKGTPDDLEKIDTYGDPIVDSINSETDLEKSSGLTFAQLDLLEKKFTEKKEMLLERIKKEGFTYELANKELGTRRALGMIETIRGLKKEGRLEKEDGEK